MPPGNYSDAQAEMIVAYLYSMKASAPAVGLKLKGDANRGKEIFEGRGHCLELPSREWRRKVVSRPGSHRNWRNQAVHKFAAFSC